MASRLHESLSATTVHSGETRLAAVIGHPVRHSLSPLIYNTAFAATGLDWTFVAFDVDEPDVPAALAAMRVLGFGGLSVTMPDKEAVARSVDLLSPAATALGAVNCVVPDGDRLVGHNTDGAGFVDALRHDLDTDCDGASIGVLGAGGAARAVIRAVAEAGATRVVVVGRSPDRVELAASLAGRAGEVGVETDLGAVDVVVNATPVGMGGDLTLPLDADLLHDGQLVVDLIYHPLETALLRSATERGARTANGIGMLVHQAAHQFVLYTGADAPLGAMQHAVIGAVSSR